MATSPKTPRAEILPDVWLDARRVLWFSRLGVLAVADLHWGYAASHRARGNLLPAWGDEDIAARLREVIAEYRPPEMLWLGDSLHTLTGRSVAEAFLRSLAVRTIILSGNHDRRWKVVHGECVTRGDYFFHHGDAVREVPEGCVEVVGHHHPAASLHDGAGTNLKVPALVASPRRLILPAFSPWAAGVPWRAKPAEKETLWAVTPRRVFAVKA